MKDPILELESISDIQDRIDRVGKDLSSGLDVYSKIPVTELAELLGISFEDEGDWCRTFWAHKHVFTGQIENYYEYVNLLCGLVADTRYQELMAIAEKIKADPKLQDIQLSQEEITFLEDAYIKLNGDDVSSDITVVFETLKTRDGDDLYFEACVVFAQPTASPLLLATG